jgi:hypothetical protein
LLASSDLNRIDRSRLRATFAKATQAVLGMSDKQDPTNTWATLELGLPDPVDHITITDWTTVMNMIEGKANPLASQVIMSDSTIEKL